MARLTGQGGHLARFWHDRRGATALEFAVVANVFLLLVFLTFEAAWAMTVELALNDAVQAASRLGSLGALPPKGSREDAIKAAMVAQASGLLDNNNLTVRMQSYGGVYYFNPAHRPANATQTAGAGSSRWLVQYAVTYTQPLLTPLASLVLGGQTSLVHNTTIIVQNEPF